MPARMQLPKGLRSATVAGLSMEPVLQPGDVVVYAPGVRPRPGDVAVLGGVVHRIVWIDPLGGIWHVGDALNAFPGRRTSCEGQVVAIVREQTWLEVRRSPRSTWRNVWGITRATAGALRRRSARTARRWGRQLLARGPA